MRIIAQGIRELRIDKPDMGVILITQYQHLLDEVIPDYIHVLIDGRIVASGGMELAEQLDKHGFNAVRTDSVGV